MFGRISSRRAIERILCCRLYDLLGFMYFDNGKTICINLRRLSVHWTRRSVFIVSLILLLFIFIFRVWGNRQQYGEDGYVFSRETILEVRSSRFYNITVAQSGSLRMLRTKISSVHSLIDIEHPNLIQAEYICLQLLCLLWYPEPERILIIGLGAGTIPNIFHYLSPYTQIDVVEIDSAIVDLAQKYFFNITQNNSTHIFIEDGRHFVNRQASNRYDIIVVDAFGNDGMPHTLRTVECLNEFIRILKSSGIVVGNFLQGQESRYRQTFSRALFKHIYRATTQTEGNYVLIALNNQTKILHPDELRLRARDLQHSKHLIDVNWPEEIERIEHEYRWNTSATIFTDKIYEDF